VIELSDKVAQEGVSPLSAVKSLEETEPQL